MPKKALLLSFLTALMLLASGVAHAQSKEERRKPYAAVGRLVDGPTGKAETYATVSLLDERGYPVAAVISQTDGRFTLRTTTEGAYRLHVSMVGYKPFMQAVTLRYVPLDVGDVRLAQGGGGY